LEEKGERCLLDIKEALNNFFAYICSDYTEVLEIEKVFNDTPTEFGYSKDTNGNSI